MPAEIIEAVVAVRKTVLFDGKYVGPGTVIRLSSDEVAELRALGFLIDPEAPAAPETGAGPDFGPADDGPAAAAG